MTVASDLIDRFSGEPDYGGLGLTDQGVVVWWRGEVSEALRARVRHWQREACFSVLVEQAREVGVAELEEQGHRVVLAHRRGFPLVFSAGPSPDGRALLVSVPPGTLDRLRQDGMPLEILLGITIPTRVTEEDRPVPAAG